MREKDTSDHAAMYAALPIEDKGYQHILFSYIVQMKKQLRRTPKNERQRITEQLYDASSRLLINMERIFATMDNAYEEEDFISNKSALEFINCDTCIDLAKYGDRINAMFVKIKQFAPSLFL